MSNHKARARELLAYSKDAHSTDRARLHIAEAQVHATLALAEEQRFTGRAILTLLATSNPDAVAELLQEGR